MLTALKISSLTNMKVLRNRYRQIRRMAHVLLGQDVWFRKQVECDAMCLGGEGASWMVCASLLSPQSIVYSFGVGEEISFDLKLIERFDTRVHAFDPTPRSIQWLQEQSLPERFQFHPYGVADLDGSCRFCPPVNPAHVSHTLLRRETPWPGLNLPVHRLATIMKMLGHKRIDLLKMDIEGAEYAVVADLLASQIQVGQLLVEFHHRWREVGIQSTKQAIQALNDAGYLIFNVSPGGEEYSFRGPHVA